MVTHVFVVLPIKIFCETAEIFLDNRDDIDAFYNDGSTLIYGANINIKEFKNGWTPLRSTSICVNVEIIPIVINHNANI